MEIKELLQTISESSGVSGYEHHIANKVAAACPWADDIQHDKLGNLIMRKQGVGSQPHPKVMLAAHMDEIGLIVTKVEEKGFLRFSTIGGFDQRVLLAQEVVVHGRQDLSGIIGAKPPHVQEPNERNKSVDIEDLFIDIGYGCQEEVQQLVNVGDLATLRRPVVNLQGDHMAGKAMDDRASVAVLLECLKELTGRTHLADVYAVATVQEEVGLRGAVTSTFGIVPDIGIAIDVGHGDIPGLPESQTIKLGQGPGIALGPHVHPKLHQRFVEIAKNWNIKYTPDPSPYPGGTDTFAIQVSQSAVPTILLSLPLRYMHTPVETLDYNDVRQTARLLALFIAELETEFVEGLVCF